MLNGTSSYGRMHATHWFLPWILSTFTTTFAWHNSEISRYWSFSAELCASGVLDDPGLWGYFRHTWPAHTKISRKWEFPPSRYFVIFLEERCDLLVVRVGRDPPTATWPAPTQHMTAQQHTQPTAACMKPPARHHEQRTTAIAVLAL